MSQASSEYWRLAREAKDKAEGRTDELRGVLMAIGAAYVVLARVQEALDDKRATYESHPTH